MPDRQPPYPWRERTPHGAWRGGPPWMRGVEHKRRFLFFRFIAFMGVLSFIFLVAFAVILIVAANLSGDVPQVQTAFVLAACTVPALFVGFAVLFASLAFRRMGAPVADVMAAADAVAEGDFNVRVREDAPGEFGRLAKSFNRMTGELARAEQQRRNLTSDVAHELRNPLHIIQGNLEGILDGVYEPTQEHISATLEETHLLARLVEDLQVLSLAESGQLPLHKRRFLVSDLLSDVVESFRIQAAEAAVELVVDLPEGDRAIDIEADFDRLDQVLSNLIANSLRYTPEGGRITLRARDLEGTVRLEVEDTGSGIPEDDLPYVFDRFWRGDRSRTRTGRTGSGLGLAIAKQLVQAHGGRISVDSKPGSGTKFDIDLPAE